MPPTTGTESTAMVYGNIRTSLAKIDQVSKKGEQYVDLYLVHAPRAGPHSRVNNWEAMVKARKEGWVRDIGVSNLFVPYCFPLAGITADQCIYSGIRHLKELPGPTPTVNQIELHPWCQQREIVSYCQEHNIAVQAYCPILKADPKKLGDPVIARIGKKYDKDGAQILIRWSLQKGYVLCFRVVD